MDHGGVLQRYYRFKDEKYFKAALNTVPKLRISADNNNIILIGHFLGEVRLIRNISGLFNNMEHGTISISKPTLEQVATNLLSSESYSPSQEAGWMALFHILIADRLPLPERIDSDYRMNFRNFKHQVLDIQKDYRILEQELLHSDFNSAVRDIINGKIVFITNGGLLGFTEENKYSHRKKRMVYRYMQPLVHQILFANLHIYAQFTHPIRTPNSHTQFIHPTPTPNYYA